jgi:hypothetical protein
MFAAQAVKHSPDSPGRESGPTQLPPQRLATDAYFAEALARTNLEPFASPAAEYRLPPVIALRYTLEQFGAWQLRKEANAEPHADSKAKFDALPPNVQENIARLAELRLLAWRVAFTDEGLERLQQLGRSFTSDGIQKLKAELDRREASGEPLLIPELEAEMGTNTASYTVSETLLRIHHATWRANLAAPHDFNLPHDELPAESATGLVSGKQYPASLRRHSEKANLVNVYAQVAAFATSFPQEIRIPYNQATPNPEAPDGGPVRLLWRPGGEGLQHLDQGARRNQEFPAKS